LTSSLVRTVTLDGHAVGAVATWVVRSDATRSTRFQDQYVIQLMAAVAGRNVSPHFVRADGRVLALSTSGRSVAGWFESGRVVVLVPATTATPLADLAVGVLRRPSGRTPG
jgi:hypothetical protein